MVRTCWPRHRLPDLHGTAVTWITATGPRSGRAQVWADGAKKALLHNYRRTGRWPAASRAVRRCAHRQDRGPRAQGCQGCNGHSGRRRRLAGTTTTASPSLRLTWPRGTSAKASGGAFVRDDLAGASTTFRFRGTGVTWVSATGPRSGPRSSSTASGCGGWTPGRPQAKFKVARSFTGLRHRAHDPVKVLGRHRRLVRKPGCGRRVAGRVAGSTGGGRSGARRRTCSPAC
jgi:hypothetical protein